MNVMSGNGYFVDNYKPAYRDIELSNLVAGFASFRRARSLETDTLRHRYLINLICE